MNLPMSNYLTILAVLLCVIAAWPVSACADDDLTVLSDQPAKQFELLLKRQFNEHLDRRLEAYGAIRSRADCEKWQRERRDFFIRQIGGFPERTPLNAKVVGSLKGDGYRVEKVVPGVWLHAARRRSPSMIADHANRRSRAGHHDPRRSTLATHGPEPGLRQIEDQRLRDPIRPFIQSQHSVAGINCVLQGLRFIRNSVADRPEPENIGHRKLLPSFTS